MTDKKTFGSFIKEKRCEKGLSQKELAELLFVTEGAVSKWERGISYPDITLISKICTALDVSEHELITSSVDTAERRDKRDARRFRTIKAAWITVPTVCYGAAALICFICNLAIEGTLSWFFVVLASLACAFTFLPGVHCFFEERRLLIFSATSCLSVWLLMLVCALRSGDLSWVVTACIGVLMGWSLIFLPILLAKSPVARWRWVITFSALLLLTELMLINIRLTAEFPLLPGMLIATYCFAPAILFAGVCLMRLGGFIKAAACTAVFGVMGYFADGVVNAILGVRENCYQVNFRDWAACAEGNIYCIYLAAMLLLSAVFLVVGTIKRRRAKPE